MDGGLFGAISSTFRMWHPSGTPTTGLRTIPHRPTGCVHTTSCLQHSNGARGSCGYRTHSELNAGLIVIFRSSHPPLFDWNAWSLRFRSSPGSLKDEASNLAVAFWGRIGEFLMRSRTGSELSPDEKALWIQSGLAVSPLMGMCLQYSLDFWLGWALIGEWTSRVLFPVPKGPWPRHGQCRTPRIVAWARAAFEQGALPSLLMMPGLAPVLSLLGDRMFQATEVTDGHQRPAIMHAY